MSLFRKIAKIGGNILKSTNIPGVSQAGAVISATANKMSKSGLRALPGAGQVLAPIAGGVAGTVVADRFFGDGTPMPRRRRRSKGITGTELKGFRRVAKMLDQYCQMVKTTKGKSCR